ncbi:hypothetical protein ACOMHN_055126 [Nucella lapillus]
MIVFLFLPFRDKSISSYDFNLFGFGVNSKGLSLVDTSTCFADSQRLPVRFSIPKDQEDIVRENVQLFKLGIQKAISEHTGISLNRVADIQLYFFNDDDMVVTLDLLGMPPAYQDVDGPNIKQNISNAFKLLKDSFNEDSFALVYSVGIVVKVSFDGLLVATLADASHQLKKQRQRFYRGCAPDPPRPDPAVVEAGLLDTPA